MATDDLLNLSEIEAAASPARPLSALEESLIAEDRVLRAALLRYGGHSPSCDYRFGCVNDENHWEPGKCDCGFESLKAKLEACQ